MVMMTKPEERLRDRIAEVLLEAEGEFDLNSDKMKDAQELALECYKYMASEVIDRILKPQLEFIDSDSEAKGGDLIHSPDIEGYDVVYGGFPFRDTEIIQRNGKNAFNVDKINYKGNDDE